MKKRSVKGKKKTKGRKVQRTFKTGQLKLRTVKAPISKSIQSHGTGTVSYGAAPYEETLGQGMRISAHFRGHTIQLGGAGSYASDSTTSTCIFGSYSAIAESGWPTECAERVNPSFHLFDRQLTTWPMEASLFATTANGTTWSYNMLGGIARNFRRMAVRKLLVHYVPSCSTNTVGTLTLACDFENMSSRPYTPDIVAQTRVNCSTSVWQTVTLEAINDHDMRKPATRLLETDAYGASQENGFQLIGYINNTPTATKAVYGTVYYTVVVDLYGLSGDSRNIYYEQTSTDSERYKRYQKELLREKIMTNRYADLGSTSSSSSSSASTISSTFTTSPSIKTKMIDDYVDVDRKEQKVFLKSPRLA